MKNLKLFAACLLAISCSSGGGGTGSGGSGGQGQAGANAGSSGGTASAGAGGTQSSAGSGGSAGGGASGGVAGSASGTGGNAGSGGSAGTAGQAGTGGAAGGAGGRGGGSGSGGGVAGRGGASGNAGAGGRGGSGGSAGGAGSGGTTASPVTPTMSGSRYRFAWGDIVLEVDASVGARVATLSISGADIIVPSAAAAHVDGGTALDPTTWGSVFWTSPRSAWTPVQWPPPPNIDNATYTGMITGGTHAVFSGPADTSIGVAMSKDYSVDATSGWISIAYTIKATKAQKAAPWEVSRVPRGGLTFFPVPGASSVVNQVPLTIMQTGSSPTIVWFDDGPKTATSPNGDKLYADGSGGWTAYVLNGNLFLKKFTDIPASAQPTGEGEVDVYPGAGFLEFEVEGPSTMISANGTLPWSIQWKVVKVPSSVTIAAGSTSLVNFVMQQLSM
jgi:hypothetical protein